MPDLDLHREFESINLGDECRNRRAALLVSTIARRPAAGFPSAFKNEADLEAFYRFVNNDAVELSALQAPHQRESWRRAAACGGAVLVAHDTSEFTYPGETERAGLSRRGNSQSFHGHFALALAEGDTPVVHGVVGWQAHIIEDGVWCRATDDGDLFELLVGSDRWSDLAAEVRQEAPAGQQIIHVMDREADDYALWTRLIEQGDDFVIRGQHDRRLQGQDSKLFEALQETPFVISRQVVLSRRSKRRPPGSRRTHPPRDQRPANLSIRAGRVTVKRPACVAPLGEASMELSVVEVVEIDPPADATPIHWLLLSTLPVTTAEEICRIVDIYRKRWLIEEFFKALKTGCGAEKRQARSLSSLLSVVALLVPIAWRLLAVRALSRHAQTTPAVGLLDPMELQALRQLARGYKLPPQPTCRDVLLAIARVGGHLKSNGEPGWLVLGRGMEQLLDFAAGWRAAMVFAAGDGGAQS